MELEFQSGLATPYFITDAQRSIAIIEAPCALVLAPCLGLEELADALSRFVAKAAAAQRQGLFAPKRKRQADTAVNPRETLRADFDRLLKGEMAFSFACDHPVVFFGHDMTDEAVQVAVILKLRGMGLIVAIELPGTEEEIERTASQWGSAFADSMVESSADQTYRAYRFERCMNIVAGLHKTVLSTELTPDAIMQGYPGLCQAPGG
jgi:hypothetical protein